MSTENCGSFSMKGDYAKYEALDTEFTAYDFSTRGYDFGFPPTPTIASMTKSAVQSD